MGAMRQLASMMRHVQETNSLGGLEESLSEALLLLQGNADHVSAVSEQEPAEDADGADYQRR